MKKDEEREVPDPWESIEEVLVVVLKVLEVFLEVSYIDNYRTDGCWNSVLHV